MKLDNEEDRNNLMQALDSVQLSGTAKQCYQNSKVILELIEKIQNAEIEEQLDAPVENKQKGK